MCSGWWVGLVLIGLLLVLGGGCVLGDGFVLCCLVCCWYWEVDVLWVLGWSVLIGLLLALGGGCVLGGVLVWCWLVCCWYLVLDVFWVVCWYCRRKIPPSICPFDLLLVDGNIL